MDAPPKGQAGQAHVTSSIPAGSILLAGPKGDVALVWKAGEKKRERGLHPGKYRIRTTRVEIEEDGTHWFVSSTGPKGSGRVLALELGKPTRIDVDHAVHFKGTIRPKKGKLQLGFAIQAADGRGLSVYKEGKRVPVTYEVLSKEGRVLAKGTLNYG